MSTIRFLIVLGMGAIMSVLSNPALAQGESEVVAEIDGRKVTTQELEHKEAGKLLQAHYKYYLTEREALEQFIDDELVDLQAKKEGVTADELFKRHVSSTIPEPTEDQLRFYYEGVQTDEPYESARIHIIDTIHQLRLKKARDAYIAQLKADYKVIVELSQPSAQVETAGASRLGPADAPVQIVEFADYECPFCQQVNSDIDRVREQFGNKVSLVFKDFPLPMHPLAEKAAEAARCAGAQGKFWEFHDYMFQTKHLQTSYLKEEARALKLDGDRFDKCLDSGEQGAAVKRDSQEGRRLGLEGTPSFFINGHFLSGNIGFAKLRETVMQELGPALTGTKSAALTSNQSETSK